MYNDVAMWAISSRAGFTWVLTACLAVIVGSMFFVSGASAAGDPATGNPTSGAPQVEIKKHSTGKEATVQYGDREWFIHIDVDQDRTMIIHSESKKGQEVKNQAEIIDRPMSPAEVDRVINDFVSGLKSTFTP